VCLQAWNHSRILTVRWTSAKLQAGACLQGLCCRGYRISLMVTVEGIPCSCNQRTTILCCCHALQLDLMLHVEPLPLLIILEKALADKQSSPGWPNLEFRVACLFSLRMVQSKSESRERVEHDRPSGNAS
jgi:hypothetical protein